MPSIQHQMALLRLKKTATGAITVWNEMKTPWQWQFDDLSLKLWPQEPLCDGVLQRQSDTFNLEQGKLPKSLAMAAATEDWTKWQGSVITVLEFWGV